MPTHSLSGRSHLFLQVMALLPSGSQISKTIISGEPSPCADSEEQGGHALLPGGVKSRKERQARAHKIESKSDSKCRAEKELR